VGLIKAGRRKGRTERDLEKSLESPSLFRQSHMGRLAIFDDEAGPTDEPAAEQRQAAVGRAGAHEQVVVGGVGEEAAPSVRASRHDDAYYSPIAHPAAAPAFPAPSPWSAGAGAGVAGGALVAEAAGANAEQARHLHSLLPPSRDGEMAAWARGAAPDIVAPLAPPAGDRALDVADDVLSERAEGSTVQEQVSRDDTAVGKEEAEGVVRATPQPRGLLAQVRALQKRGLVSAEEGDELFDLMDQDHAPLIALHKRLVAAPAAPGDQADADADAVVAEGLAEELRRLLRDKAAPHPAHTDLPAGVGVVGVSEERGRGVRRGLAPVAAGVVIPERPRGRVLSLYIWSTWGDVYYVGLNGIDVYDGSGAPVVLSDPAASIR